MEIDGGQKIFIFKEDLPYEGRVNFPGLIGRFIHLCILCVENVHRKYLVFSKAAVLKIYLYKFYLPL